MEEESIDAPESPSFKVPSLAPAAGGIESLGDFQEIEKIYRFSCYIQVGNYIKHKCKPPLKYAPGVSIFTLDFVLFLISDFESLFCLLFR